MSAHLTSRILQKLAERDHSVYSLAQHFKVDPEPVRRAICSLMVYGYAEKVEPKSTKYQVYAITKSGRNQVNDGRPLPGKSGVVAGPAYHRGMLWQTTYRRAV